MKSIIISLFLLLSLQSQALVVLQYHHVSDTGPVSTRVSPERFRMHMQQIEKLGYRVVSIDVLADALRKNVGLPDKAVVITFDDGYHSIYEQAYPELKKRKWPFTVFINPEPHDVGRKTHMSWAQLKEMSANGASIANHSWSHAHVLRRDTKDIDASLYFKEEIERTEKRIEQQLGYSLKLFAYPYGEYDSAIQKQLIKHGYLGFAQQSGAVPNDVSKEMIPRFPFGGVYGEKSDFLLKLKTLPFSGLKEKVYSEHGQLLSESLLPSSVERPVVVLELGEQLQASALNCFASGQGGAQLDLINKNTAKVQAKKKLAVGRSRYNCTLRSNSGRYHWWSTTFIQKGKDGQWHHL
ncbi:polysaccharide deacetylase family protein [Agaribacterium sp. ZY112]|uniref:polysaccharide deacetylase family protein n=1 Tax=Agaribacterium sp. ZY112 TaxID=3233574 RepID=UPI003523BFD5